MSEIIVKRPAPKLYRFHLDIGDWSGDGHGKKKTFLIESNKPVGACREAYFKARRLFVENIWPESIYSKYNNPLTPTASQIIATRAHGFDFSYYLGDEEYISPESMAHYTLWFIMRGNTKIKAYIIPPPATFAFCGSDRQGRHIGFIGYGCFE